MFEFIRTRISSSVCRHWLHFVKKSKLFRVLIVCNLLLLLSLKLFSHSQSFRLLADREDYRSIGMRQSLSDDKNVLDQEFGAKNSETSSFNDKSFKKSSENTNSTTVKIDKTVAASEFQTNSFESGINEESRLKSNIPFDAMKTQRKTVSYEIDGWKSSHRMTTMLFNRNKPYSSTEMRHKKGTKSIDEQNNTRLPLNTLIFNSQKFGNRSVFPRIEIPETVNEDKRTSCQQPDDPVLTQVFYNDGIIRKTLSQIPVFKDNEDAVMPALTYRERETVKILLEKFIMICDLYRITHYFLFSGSLLGSYRHFGMQPWDDDIDILMNFTERERTLNAFETYTAEFSPDFGVVFIYDRIKLFHKTRSIPIMYNEHRWPFLDLSFYHENRTHIWELDELGEYNFVRKSLIFPLHRRPFEGLMINSPKNGFEVLRQLYWDKGCVALTYFHRKEQKTNWNISSFDCELVSGVYPFVHRRFVGSCVQEFLMLNGSVLYSMLTDEPIVSAPYELLQL